MQVEKPIQADIFPSWHHETHRLFARLKNNKWQQPLKIFQSQRNLPVLNSTEDDKEQRQNGRAVMEMIFLKNRV